MLVWPADIRPRSNAGEQWVDGLVVRSLNRVPVLDDASPIVAIPVGDGGDVGDERSGSERCGTVVNPADIAETARDSSNDMDSDRGDESRQESDVRAVVGAGGGVLDDVWGDVLGKCGIDGAGKDPRR